MAQRGTWQIVVTGQDNPLCTYNDAVKAEPLDGGRSIMTVEGYGAPNVAFLDLAVQTVTRKFTMQREHPDNTASTAWYMTDAIAYTGVNDVTVTHIDIGGVETSWLIPGAKILITVDEPINVSTTTHITLTGGSAMIQA